MANNLSTSDLVVSTDDATANEVETTAPSSADLGMIIPSDAQVLNDY